MSFASLHTHSQFSVLDGAGSWEEYVARAQELGTTAISATDHGTLAGHRALQRAVRGTDIKPILGIETYFSPTDRFDNRARGTRQDLDVIYNHLIIHAMNEQGLKNLNKINQEAWTSGFYQKARMDRELLEKYGDDLIVTSACMSGPIADPIRKGNSDVAYKRAEWFKDRFGDRFYIEVMAENPDWLNSALLTIADELKIKPVLTEDCHYVRPEDLWIEEALLIVNTKPKPLKGGKFDPDMTMVEKFNALYGDMPIGTDGGRMTFQHYSVFMAGRDYRREQMIAQGIDREDIFDNTVEIADRIDEYPYHENLNLLPRATKNDPQMELGDLCRKGMETRGLYGNEYEERLQHELKVIGDKGFESYFLIVGDLMRWAKEQGIMCGFARGSAAGSLVCYVLGITEVNPLEWGLIFERFLDPSRPDWPDIDLDIQDDRRDEVKAYLEKKYGYASNIITLTMYKEKNSLKDAASILRAPFGETNKALKELSSENAFEEYLQTEKSREFHKKYPDVLELAKALEGRIKSAGMHPAGVVVSSVPLTDYVPIQSAKGSTDVRIPLVAYDMEEAESIGLQKIDLLGLKTLRVIQDAFDAIAERHGKQLKLTEIPINDRDTYKMLSDGRTKGVFQAEGAAFHQWIVETGVVDFNDLVIGTSIARPGPMNTVGPIYKRRLRKEEKVRYIHPVMEETLKETLGVIIYQEQLMKMIVDLAGLTVEESNGIRRTVAKKKDPALLEKYREKFIAGASEKIKPEQAEKLWHDIEAHAGYSFNKSHAVAYSMLTNATAWLKRHYPIEYMWSLLKNENGTSEDSKFAITDYLIEAKRMGIKILLPHVNQSELQFSMEKDAIRFGLANVKSIAEKSGNKLLALRPFNNYAELVEAVEKKGSGLNKNMLKSLNMIGAATFEDNPRRGGERDNLYEILNIPNFSTTVESDKFVPLAEFTEDGAYAVLAMVRKIVRKDHWARADLVDSSGTAGAFFDPNATIDAGQMYALLISENSVVRYIPVDDLEKVNDAFTEYLFGKQDDLTPGFYRVVSYKKRETKAGKKMANLVLLDHEGTLIPIVAFPQKYMLAAAHLREGATKMITIGEWNGARTLEKVED